MRDAGAFGLGQQVLGLGYCDSQGLIAEHVLARVNGRQQWLVVQRVDQAVVHHVERRIAHKAVQIGTRMLDPELCGQCGHLGGVAPIQRDSHRVARASDLQTSLPQAIQANHVQPGHAPGAKHPHGKTTRRINSHLSLDAGVMRTARV